MANIRSVLQKIDLTVKLVTGLITAIGFTVFSGLFIYDSYTTRTSEWFKAGHHLKPKFNIMDVNIVDGEADISRLHPEDQIGIATTGLEYLKFRDPPSTIFFSAFEVIDDFWKCIFAGFLWLLPLPLYWGTSAWLKWLLT